MADVFLSYANDDRDCAKMLAGAVEQHGWSVWWDRKIPLGTSWDRVIEEQVDAARCIVVLWSKESIASDWVKTEAREGKARGILVPVLIDGVKIPLEFRHMQAANLAAWRAGEPSGDFDILLARLTELLGPGRTSEVAGRDAGRAALPAVQARHRADPASVRPAEEVRLAATLGGPAAALCLCFLPDGERLASLWEDRSIRIWRIEDGKLLETLRGEGHDAWRVSSCAGFSPDGTLLATTPDIVTLLVWRVSDGRLLHTLKGHTAVIDGITFSADGSRIASASADKTAGIWSTTDGTLVRRLEGHTQWVRSIAFSPDGETVATGAEVVVSAPELKLWHVADGKVLCNLAGHSSTIFDLAFSPDGTLLASGSNDNSTKTWHLPDGASVRTFLAGGSVQRVAFSPDGRLLATVHLDKMVGLWSIDDGRLLHSLQGHGGTIKSVAFSGDGRFLATGSADNTVRLWLLSNE
jgi:WD40 repeat protein